MTALKSLLSSGQRIFVHGQSAVPYRLIEEVVQCSSDLKDLEFIHLHVEGRPAHTLSEFSKKNRVNNLFVGPSLRDQMDYDRLDYTPLFLSEIPAFIKSGRCPIDIALVQVSPPDRFGYCTLGVSVDIARAAVDSAKVVLAQVNSNMPRTYGDSLIHVSKFRYVIETNNALPEVGNSDISTDVIEKIGYHVASLIEDGATLQLGIGAVPDAVLRCLNGHRHLGVHSELCSDGVVTLLESGVIDNSQKKVHAGKTIASFVQGTKKIYEFVNANPSVELYPSDYVNSPAVIARNPKVVAINSAVEIDLTGQVCADSIGHHIISGVGGQVDFVRGAAMSSGGKSIIAVTSRTKRGVPRIVPSLALGAGVVTTRADVHYVVTEFGIADLHGKTLRQRAQQLLSIAHPDDRDALSAAWRRIYDLR
jgi:acyl-CoA hydrolase